MRSEDIMEQVRQFLGQFVGDSNMGPDVDLVAAGLVNSLLAMQLVLFVEKEFGIQVANEDLDYENFKSLKAIVGFVEKKLGATT